MKPEAHESSRRRFREYILSLLITLGVSVVCYAVADLIGYRTVALILLFTVSLLAILFSVYPVLLSAVLSALIWDFFFIPPFGTFHIERAEDVLMLFMYLTIALLNGILTSRIKQYEKQVRQKEQRLQALKLYNALFNSISHELRTPLTTLLGAAENLITENKKIPEQDRVFLLSEILLAATRLNRLVDNMLNMSRLESGMLQPKLDWCDYNELVHNVLNRLKPELAHHPVTLQIQDDLPLVKIDFGLIEQALFNILHNISVHTPAATEVNISVNCRNHILETTVADNGPGFREEELAMVFEKFYRTPVSKTGGLGLGLSIARGFIQAHNGTIQLAHNKPQGARFTIHIPVETTTLEPEHE